MSDYPAAPAVPRTSDTMGITQKDAGVAAPSPLQDAFAYAADRSDRMFHTIGALDHIIARLTDRLTPALTNGEPASTPTDPDPGTAHVLPEDRRSSLTRRVSSLAQTTDTHADMLSALIRRLDGILDALEV